MFVEAIPIGNTAVTLIEEALMYSWHYAAELHLPASSLDALAAGRYPRLVRAEENFQVVDGRRRAVGRAMTAGPRRAT